jgi:proteic killer suppression protein
MVRTLVRFSAGSVALTIALALSVVASAANAALAPTLRIDPAAVVAGAKVDVVGRAFPAAMTVALPLDRSSVGQASVDATGAFVVKLTVPMGTSTGPHTVTACVPDAGQTRVVEIDPPRLFDPAAAGWYGGDLHIHMNYSGDLVCAPGDAARMQPSARCDGQHIRPQASISSPGNATPPSSGHLPTGSMTEHPRITPCVNNATRYHGQVLRSFRDKDTTAVWARQRSRKLDNNLQRAALRKLTILDAAESLDDLRVPPGNRLEKLKGDRAGQHSIRINDQWRICFRWTDAGPEDVEITDYH